MVELLARLPVGQDWVDFRIAIAQDKGNRRHVLAGQVFAGPILQGEHDWSEGFARIGQPILVPQGAFLIGVALEEPRRLKPFQPLRQKVPGDAKPLLKAVKAAFAQEAFPENQQGPAIPDHAHGPCNRAGGVFHIMPFHDAWITWIDKVLKWN